MGINLNNLKEYRRTCIHYIVKVPFESTEISRERVKWAIKNIVHHYENDAYYYDFDVKMFIVKYYFHSGEDAALFKLRWG